MTGKDAHILKVLAELGHVKETKLTPEQEAQLKYASDPEYRELEDLRRLFITKQEK